jgi:hypothetical protein
MSPNLDALRAVAFLGCTWNNPSYTDEEPLAHPGTYRSRVAQDCAQEQKQKDIGQGTSRFSYVIAQLAAAIDKWFCSELVVQP